MSTPRLSKRLQAILDALPLTPGMRVLEVGCGTGALARAMADRVGAGQVLAIDRSARAIAQGQSKGQNPDPFDFSNILTGGPNMEPRKTPKPKLTAEAAYENSHLVARDLLDRIADLLQDMPAPGNDDHPIHWGRVATSAGNGCFSVRTTCSRNRRTAGSPSSRGCLLPCNKM